MPFIFLTSPDDDNDTVRKLILLYEFDEMTFTEDSGWTEESRMDTLTYFVTFNNMIAYLTTQDYGDFPLAMDVDSWEILAPVNIGSYTGVVKSSGIINGYACWTCDVGVNESYVSYDKASGVLVVIFLIDTEYQLFILLQEMNFGPTPQPYVKDEGVLLTAIFIELAVIVFLLGDRRKKSN